MTIDIEMINQASANNTSKILFNGTCWVAFIYSNGDDMQETLFIRLNELILVFYLISIACYFIDFVKKHYIVSKVGFVI